MFVGFMISDVSLCSHTPLSHWFRICQKPRDRPIRDRDCYFHYSVSLTAYTDS